MIHFKWEFIYFRVIEKIWVCVRVSVFSGKPLLAGFMRGLFVFPPSQSGSNNMVCLKIRDRGWKSPESNRGFPRNAWGKNGIRSVCRTPGNAGLRRFKLRSAGRGRSGAGCGTAGGTRTEEHKCILEGILL